MHLLLEILAGTLLALIVCDAGKRSRRAAGIVLWHHGVVLVVEVSVSPGSAAGERHGLAIAGERVSVRDRARDGVGRRKNSLAIGLIVHTRHAAIVRYALGSAVGSVCIGDCLGGRVRCGGENGGGRLTKEVVR